MYAGIRNYNRLAYLGLIIVLVLPLISGCASSGVTETPSASAVGGAAGPTSTTGGGIIGETPTAAAIETPTTAAVETPTTAATSAISPTTAATGTVAPTETVMPTTAVTGTATITASMAISGTLAPGSIRMSVVRGAMIDTMRKLAQQYEAANPGKKVYIEEEPEGGAFEALIAAGNQPDIITASFGSQIGSLASEGAVLPLDDLPGMQDLLNRLDPATYEKLYGHYFYIPAGTDVTMLIYNKDLFQEAGLDPNKPPTTFAEYLDYAQKIQALPARSNGDKVYGNVFWNDALAWGGWYWNMLQPMYLNANQDACLLLNKLGTDIVFDQPECKMAEFFDFNAKAQQYAPPTMEKNFFSRSIGMWPQYGYSWEPNLKEALNQPMVIGQDVGIAPVPVPNAGDTAYSTLGGRAFMIMKTNPQRQQDAWQFVQYLMQDDNNLVFLKELGYLPVIETLKSDTYFQDPTRQPFVEMLKTSVLPQQYDAADKAANAILGVYQKVAVERTMTPQEGVTAAAKDARSALGQ